eukprot:TRINITY_DN4191_c0_g2_i1.p1 TRINITY_DN4191_c0_g2~~TRINITY_DN4191_c0_g2_i1.p1  ORF type:complete len:132 (-),score=28.51 TRINITY_DN4191_c0_g2_i1:25-420(-)
MTIFLRIRDKLQKINENNVDQLLDFADLYSIDPLMIECLLYLGETICDRSIEESLVYYDKYKHVGTMFNEMVLHHICWTLIEDGDETKLYEYSPPLLDEIKKYWPGDSYYRQLNNWISATGAKKSKKCTIQ